MEPVEEAVSVGARLAVACALLSFASCEAPKTIFAWGHYEESVYHVCRGAGTFDLAQDIQILAQDVDRARDTGQQVAPGVHAHLGYLYYVSGNVGAAIAQFHAEKLLYPESAKFIDGMLARLKT
jgi:hypothetical protein